MTCREALPLLRDLLDRELDAARAGSVEAHCASCANCRAARDAEGDLKAVIRSRFRVGPAPPALSAEVSRRIRAEAERDAGRRRSRRRRTAGLAAASAVLATVGVLAWRLLPTGGESPPAGSTMSAELVDDHIRYASVDRPTEMATSRRSEAEEWFSARLDLAVCLPEFDAAEMRLLGGRLCYLFDRRVALLFYERSGRRLSLFVMNPAGLAKRVSDPSDFSSPSTPGEVVPGEVVKGYRVLCWQREGLLYALVADSRQDGLVDLVERAYRD